MPVNRRSQFHPWSPAALLGGRHLLALIHLRILLSNLAWNILVLTMV